MTAVALVEAAELRLPQNSLTCAIDRTGQYYRVPIACINNPNTYGRNEELQRMKSKKSPKMKKINVSFIKFKLVVQLRIRFGTKDVTIAATNKSSIAECKNIFLKEV